jgi:DNA-binding FrmR family transcriptional regulator
LKRSIQISNHPHEKQLIARLAKIAGHAQSIKQMYEDGRECTEVLNQISAVRSALNSVGKLILKDHLVHCCYNSNPIS